jgi:hypothetical protein
LSDPDTRKHGISANLLTKRDRILTNPISSDNFSTQSVVKERKSGAGAQPRGHESAPRPGARTDRADVERAQQLLTQRADRPAGSAIDSIAQARERLAALKEQIAADPQAAARAFGLVNGTIFEAASARPSA